MTQDRAASLRQLSFLCWRPLRDAVKHTFNFERQIEHLKLPFRQLLPILINFKYNIRSSAVVKISRAYQLPAKYPPRSIYGSTSHPTECAQVMLSCIP